MDAFNFIVHLMYAKHIAIATLKPRGQCSNKLVKQRPLAFGFEINVKMFYDEHWVKTAECSLEMRKE